MKQHTFSTLSWLGVFLLLLAASCTDEFTPQQGATVDDTDLVQTRLTFEVAALHTLAGTRAENEGGTDDTSDGARLDTEEERKIHNIWVFQFKAQDSTLLITPRYYDVSGKTPTSEGLEADVLLKPDVESMVYVVANTGDNTWATVANSPTLAAVKSRSLPQPNNIRVEGDATPTTLSIPMEGGTEPVTPRDNMRIPVTVTRMYAKVEIRIGEIPETIKLTAIDINYIPYYCQIGTMSAVDTETPVTYPADMRWDQYAYNPGEKDAEGHYTKKMILYLPENLQGWTEVDESNPELKTKNAPADALCIDFKADYVDRFTGEVKETGRRYTVYPGGNNYNNYNIRRNYIYRVTLNIYTDSYGQDIPSSNCFVVQPGQLLSFLPYYRTEVGGDFDFKNYLNSDGSDPKKMINGSEKMTENVRIIWQTKDAIGDNSKGDKVWIDPAPDTDAVDRGDLEFHRKIYVKTAQRGNALIAAYNSDGEIIWSWHIWITENDPANVSNAIVYTTYAWNENGINTNIRVPGYAVMPCNLGALRYTPRSDNLDPETHGMLYQWGRKDPFPPGNTAYHYPHDYTDAVTGSHYDNDNTTVVGKTAAYDTNKLFHSLPGKDIESVTQEDPIGYTIHHPTVFMCGTKETMQDNNLPNNSSAYANQGDWMHKHNSKLWGGLEPDTVGSMKYLTIRKGKTYIFDNYGDKKTIFDPCPSGWRVPPGDLWLGFTSTGKNPNSYVEINTAKGCQAGMYMYMTDFKKGITSFFPTQGARVGNGAILRIGVCGNYHNATTDLNNRVNILHIHDAYNTFMIFETNNYMYYVKSTAGPVRCVRDHK